VADHEVMLLGGLGNQLFQVAFGRYLSDTTGRPVRFRALGSVSTADVERLTAITARRGIRGLNPLGRLRVLHRLTEAAVGRGVRADLTMSPVVRPDDARRSSCWCGYWQRPEYVNKVEPWSVHVAERLRALTDVTAVPHEPYVAVHVRRGDYIGTAPTLSVRYYADAFRAVCRARELDAAATMALLVSNDPAWATANLRLPTSRVLATSGSALEDLGVLTRADGIVMSHSTFSWWAARFADSSTVVAAPRPWRLGADGDDGALLRLPAWLAVDATYDE
jgi:hypothetical protein